MCRVTVTNELIDGFLLYLKGEEKSKNTIEKYLRDIRNFELFLKGDEVTRDSVSAYKGYLLIKGYAARSINSMLASVNCFLRYLGRRDCQTRSMKIQQQVYCSEKKELTKDEYKRLIFAARKLGKTRLELLLQTICATGIRVSELQFITVEAAKCGEAIVNIKGKIRAVLIVRKLQERLLSYAERQKIESGSIFVTSGGVPLNRSNIWREMKNICSEAQVDPQKVFPHNLRHLFARSFYDVQHDIAKLADVLGHSSINTTRVYIISSGSEHKKLLESMRLVV